MSKAVLISLLGRQNFSWKYKEERTVSPPYIRVPHPRIQPTMNRKRSEKKCYVMADGYSVVRPIQ